MDDAEWLRMIRYSGGGVELGKTIINRSMLRFRPIAPKPPSGDQKSGTPSNEKMRLLCSGLRRKRKYVRVAKNNMCKTKKKVLSDQVKEKEKEKEKEVGAFKTGVTLQLLPGGNDGLEESSESKALRCNLQLDMPAIKEHGDKGDKDNHRQGTISSVIFNKSTQLTDDGAGGQDQWTALNVMVRQKKVAMESWVTVECVSEVLDKCMVGRRLECTDVERVRNLEEDTCPWFVSDGSNKVHWVNDAFKRMVTTVREGNEDQERPLDIMVWLVVKDKLQELFSSYSAFSCWVRLQNSWQKDKCLNMVPCDVWRMNCGGFAWRLDVEAALSLGR